MRGWTGRIAQMWLETQVHLISATVARIRRNWMKAVGKNLTYSFCCVFPPKGSI